MFVSSHDAFFAALVAAYGALLFLCVAGVLSGRALSDVNFRFAHFSRAILLMR